MTIGAFIDEALEHGRAAIGDMFGPDIAAYFDPEFHSDIRVSYGVYAYANAAGPWGGIGGQMITGFPHVVIVLEYEYVYVYIGRERGVAGRMTAMFHERTRDGGNPWDAAKTLAKEPS